MGSFRWREWGRNRAAICAGYAAQRQRPTPSTTTCKPLPGIEACRHSLRHVLARVGALAHAGLRRSHSKPEPLAVDGAPSTLAIAISVCARVAGPGTKASQNESPRGDVQVGTSPRPSSTIGRTPRLTISARPAPKKAIAVAGKKRGKDSQVKFPVVAVRCGAYMDQSLHDCPARQLVGDNYLGAVTTTILAG